MSAAPTHEPLEPLEQPPLARVDAVLGAVSEALDELPQAEFSAQGWTAQGWTAQDDARLAARIERLAAVQARLGELQLRLARVAEQTRVADRSAATGPDAWLARLTGSSRSRMASGLWLARMLQERYPGVRSVLAAGQIDVDQARVIIRAAEQIPAEATLTEAQRADVTLTLAERAARERIDPPRLRRVARRMCERISREHPGLADAHQARLLAAEERRAAAETYLWLADQGDGTWLVKGVVPELHGQLLATVLDHLSSPRRIGRNRKGERVVDPTVEDPRCGGHSRAELQGRALCELIEHLPTDGLANHGRVGATIMVHLDLEHLLDDLGSLGGLGAARLDSGGEISAGQARRLACNAGILPAVFNGHSLPLDLGRTARLHSPAQRAALSAAHDSCAAEGCQRPFAWTEIHHLHPWSHGGTTDLHNATPLCGWHHHKAHDHHWHTETLPTGEIRYHRRP